MPIPINDQKLDKFIDKSSDVLYAQVVGRIRQWIMEGYLKEGDALPSERELAEVLGVSRMPIREALKILEFLGVVQHIRGKGVVVKKISIKQLLNSINFIVLDSSHALQDILEMRQAVENQAVNLAAQRRTQEDLDILEEALLEMERNILMNRDVNEASARFHSAVVGATHNEVMIRMNEFLMDLFQYSRKEALKDPDRREHSLESHKQILQEIKQKNSEGAVTAMQKHLQEVKKAIER